MYVEVKSPCSGRQYVYLKRSVRVGKKVKHVTVERYGELQKLELMYPGFVERLTKICEEGSHQLFLRKLMSFERGIDDTVRAKHDYVGQEAEDKKASADRGGDAGCSGCGGDAAAAVQKAAAMLFSKPLTRLDANQQEVIAVTLNPDHAPGSVIARAQGHDEYAVAGVGDCALERESLIDEGFIDAVVVAAGVGKRMGSAVPKQYLKLDDKCILEHTVLKLLISPYVRRVIVVLSPEDEYFKFTCLGDLSRVVTVHGGKERVDSVVEGLKAAKSTWVMVHDAARPLVSLFDVEKLLYSVACGLKDGYKGGLLVSKVADTLKEAQKGQEEQGYQPYVHKTVDRSNMYRAQTPQLFKTKDLLKAIQNALESHPGFITDEASAMELTGHRVMLVEGSPLNFKVTEPADLILVKALMSYCAPNI